MALAVEAERLAVACKHEVVVLANAPGLARRYPKQPDTYDSLYAPRASYYAGQIDIHGLAWGRDGLWAVNTTFSCLALLSDRYSFEPRWAPPFVTALAPEDRCHLNGLALHDDAPLYATAMGTADTPQGWRAQLPRGGVVLHVPSGEVMLRDLFMPHSPRLYDGKLYLLFSGTGEIACADPQDGTYEVVNRLDAFVRGMARCGDHLFIGRSRLRKTSLFRDLPIADKAKHCGVTAVHLPTGAIVGWLNYEASVEELFDVQVLPGLLRPGILNTRDEVHRRALTTPDTTYWAAEAKR
jgi:uncharacterized protein (TIGR03032 family)